MLTDDSEDTELQSYEGGIRRDGDAKLSYNETARSREILTSETFSEVEALEAATAGVSMTDTSSAAIARSVTAPICARLPARRLFFTCALR